jgi:hypothetical protein
MPLFSRRRLHAFLDEIQGVIGTRNTSKIAKKLDSAKTQEVFANEAELAMIWALSKLGPLHYEPDWWQGARRPDIVTDHLFPGLSCALDVTTLGEGQSDEEFMRWQCNLLVSHANKFNRKLGRFLFFNFLPDRGYRSPDYVNRLRGEIGQS